MELILDFQGFKKLTKQLTETSFIIYNWFLEFELIFLTQHVIIYIKFT